MADGGRCVDDCEGVFRYWPYSVLCEMRRPVGSCAVAGRAGSEVFSLFRERCTWVLGGSGGGSMPR
jgi:hypothetical protein